MITIQLLVNGWPAREEKYELPKYFTGISFDANVEMRTATVRALVRQFEFKYEKRMQAVRGTQICVLFPSKGDDMVFDDDDISKRDIIF